MTDALLEFENLYGMACHHIQICDKPDCNVSVRILKRTAERLIPYMDRHEVDSAMLQLRGWPR